MIISRRSPNKTHEHQTNARHRSRSKNQIFNKNIGSIPIDETRQVRVHRIKDLETLGSIISGLSTRWSQWIKIIRTPNRPLDTSNFTNHKHETNATQTSNKQNLWHPRDETQVDANTWDSPSARQQNQRSRNSWLDYLGTLNSIILELSTRWSQWIRIIRTPNRPLDTSNFTNHEHQTNETRTSNKRNLWQTPRRSTNIEQTHATAAAARIKFSIEGSIPIDETHRVRVDRIKISKLSAR